MPTKLLAVTSILAVAAVASAEISASWVAYYEGPLPWGGEYVYSFDLRVTIEGDDAWTCAGGATVDAPWITVANGTFYQHPLWDGNPPNPDFIFCDPDVQYTSFYTTHRGWSNTPSWGTPARFAYGPADTDTELAAAWFWTPDQNAYPGTFTIARFTVLAPADADPATTYADIDMLIESLEMSPPIRYQAHVPIPEPGSLALLALGGLALLRRR